MTLSISVSRFTTSILLGSTLLLPALLHATEIHPVERRLEDHFPSVPVQASATFEAAREIVGRSVVSGFRARFSHASAAPNLPGVSAAMTLPGGAEATLQVTYPRFYNDPLVAVLDEQRVVLLAVNARGAVAEVSNGKLIYREPYASVDAVEVPGRGRSEELLLLRDARAPLVYDYEIVEMRGVGAVVMDGGAIRFAPDAGEVPSAPPIAGGRFTQAPRVLQIDRPWVVDSTGRRSDNHARWTLIGDNGRPKTLRLTVSSVGLSYPLLVDPSFSYAGSLATARYAHTATVLSNGKVLIAGGYNDSHVASAELYDPSSGTFSVTGSLTTARYGHTATPLPNGKVLIAGGQGPAGYLASAELYDPVTGTFSATGNLVASRYTHTATMLPNGKVLMAGGWNDTVGYLSSAELYDPASGIFSATGNLSTARGNHTATLLPNGQVLMAGGYNFAYVSSAELYDPASGTFAGTGSLAVARYSHTATVLPNGKVLIAAGAGGPYLTSAELYDPASGLFSATGSLATGRYVHTATLLPNGKVLIAGGLGGPVISSAELYDPVAGTFSATGSLLLGRYYHTATLLPNGRLLIAAGLASGSTTSNAELYDSDSGAFSVTGSLGNLRLGHTSTLLPDGKVLIVGGQNAGYLSSAELYDEANGTFTATGNLTTGRVYHTATLLANGKVLIAGGFGGAGSGTLVTQAELYDPTTGMFSVTGSLSNGRYYNSATLLANGKVLIAGGTNNVSILTSAELYDPASGTFSDTGSLAFARYSHTATLLGHGTVLIARGSDSSAFLGTSEVYDPVSGNFSSTGNFVPTRSLHTATLLPNGKVLIAGGANTNYLSSAELYDTVSGSYSPTGSLVSARANHTATLLPNGKVLITGGKNGFGHLSSAELYDPASRTFSVTASPSVQRDSHSATMLPGGRVLITGGINSTLVPSTELYDAGLGYVDLRRPIVMSSSTTLVQPGAITLTGSNFRGDSEGSSGGYNSSATNYPLVQLQRVDNDQVVFVNSSGWSNTGFTSTALSTLADGPYRVTIFTNGLPSMQRVILVTGVAPPAVPTALSATATSSTTVAVSWAAVDGAASYVVYESEFGVGYAYILTTSATSFIHTGLQPDVTYLYKVYAVGNGGSSGFSAVDAATTVMFTDASLSGMPIQLVHLVEIRRAIAAMRVAASLPLMSFTDPMPPPGTASIKAVHITELRSGLGEARAIIGLLPPLVYTDPTITPGSTVVKAAHFTELRAGTQ